MTRRATHRSRPFLFAAVVALSAVACIGQAIATPAVGSATCVAADALRLPTTR